MDAVASVDPALMKIILSEKVAICILSMVLFVFLWCISRSVQMLGQNRQLIYWLCLFANLLGPVRELAFLLPLLHAQLDCRVVSFITNYAHEFSLDFIMSILLIKATTSNKHNVIIYIVGGICLAASIGIHTWHATTAVYTKSIFGACGNIPDPLIAIIWFGCLWTLNSFLSGCFLYVIYTHHRRNRSPIFRSFLKDGMYFFLLITVSNIITPCLITATVLGDNSSIIFDIDWALQCLLITLQLSHSCNLRQGRSNLSHSLSNHYNTRHSKVGHESILHSIGASTAAGINKSSPAEYANVSPWEEYTDEVRMEILSPSEVDALREATVAGKPCRSNSIEPLTKEKNHHFEVSNQ